MNSQPLKKLFALAMKKDSLVNNLKKRPHAFSQVNHVAVQKLVAICSIKSIVYFRKKVCFTYDDLTTAL